MQTVLVTGATGQLGSELMKLFRETPFQVHGTYNETKPDSEGNYHKMDLTLEDEILVNELKGKFVKDRFRLSGLLKNIVLSETFRSH